MKSIKLLLLSLSICIALLGKGQDTINMRSGEAIVAKVNDIGTTEIKYKKWGRLDGPIYSVLKTDVANIKYSDGTKDEFSQAKATTVADAPKKNKAGFLPYTAENIPPNHNAFNNAGFTDPNEAENKKDEKGLKQGKWKTVYDDGTFKLYQYVNDTTHGRVNYFKRDGTLDHYLEAYPVDSTRGFWSLILSDSRYENGFLKKYYEYNGQLALKVPVVDGKKNGIQQCYDLDGYLQSESPYVDDQLNGIKKVYLSQGYLWCETPYTNGKKNGREVYYDSTGEIIGFNTYTNGVKNGLSSWKEEHDWYEAMYENDKRADGWSSKYYYTDGSRMECFYKNGEYKRERYFSSDGINHSSFLNILGNVATVVIKDPSILDKNSPASTNNSSNNSTNNNGSTGANTSNQAIDNANKMDQIMQNMRNSVGAIQQQSANKTGANNPFGNGGTNSAAMGSSSATPKSIQIKPLPLAVSNLDANDYSGVYSTEVYSLLKKVYKDFPDGNGGAIIPLNNCCLRDGFVVYAAQYAWACLSYQADINNTSYTKSMTPEQAAQKMMDNLHQADKLCGGSSVAPACQCTTLDLWHCN